MNPYKSSAASENCSPISSNCVIWQGPDLPCINLCKGDTVSDVVYKLATEICTLKTSIGLTDLDLTCLVQVCQTTPEPSKTLANILELLITKVCCLSDIVSNLPSPGNNYQEPTLNLPACLQIPNGTGGYITQLVHSQYTLRIATVLCSINTTVNTHTNQISDLITRVNALENPASTVNEISSCLLGTLADVETVVQELETQFCSYKTVLGATTDITSGIAKQCTDLNSQAQLSTGLPMSSLTGWKNTVSNLGQSLNNLWLTVCDIRAAVKIIQTNCCQIDCNSIVVNFDYKWIDDTTLRLYFSPKTTVPLGFWDCNDSLGNMFTITDGFGNSYDAYIHFRREDVTDKSGVLDDVSIISGGYDLDLSLSPLVTSSGLTMTSNACFTNGDTSCVKCVTKTIVGYVNTNCCTVTSSTANTITYRICVAATTTSTTSAPVIP